jgi:hypothetical protein
MAVTKVAQLHTTAGLRTRYTTPCFQKAPPVLSIAASMPWGCPLCQGIAEKYTSHLFGTLCVKAQKAPKLEIPKDDKSSVSGMDNSDTDEDTR